MFYNILTRLYTYIFCKNPSFVETRQMPGILDYSMSTRVCLENSYKMNHVVVDEADISDLLVSWRQGNVNNALA